jgi:two-component system NarL family sensor kinase
LIPQEAAGRHGEHFKNYFASPRVRLMGNGLELTGLRRDGTSFPVEVSLSFIETARGNLAVAFISDISQRKQLEQAARERSEQVSALAANLLTVQEDERRRVSRELHDRICQQLASLAIDIGGLAVGQRGPGNLRGQLRELQSRVVTASEETRHIAYELHSSVLDDLGLLASLRDLCRQFAGGDKQHAVEFTGTPLNVTVPREVAGCVYRVAQESLQNAARHASSEYVSVALTLDNGRLILTITDDGVGFNCDEVKGRGRLGLISMEERARLVKGKLTIASQPGHGTRITLEVPLPADTV